MRDYSKSIVINLAPYWALKSDVTYATCFSNSPFTGGKSDPIKYMETWP